MRPYFLTLRDRYDEVLLSLEEGNERVKVLDWVNASLEAGNYQ